MQDAIAGAVERRRGLVGPALGCLALAILLGVLPGQDANWDLRNYHFYNPYAWLNGRLDLDVAPAQMQSWLSPYADLPYYALSRANVATWITTTILAIPAGAALFLLVLLARRLSPGRAHAWAIAAAVVTAATGAGGMPVIGTTMSDWHDVALVMAAIGLVLAAQEEPRRAPRMLALAGLCAGAAAGFKLTAAPFALGLAAMVAAGAGPLPRRAWMLAVLAAGGLLGFALVYGPWGWELYRRYGNPVFPFMNDVFRSPLVPPVSHRDTRFVADTLVEVLALPLRLTRETVGFVSELRVRDARLALALPALAVLGWSGRVDPAERRRWRTVAAMFAVAYASWAWTFGILRYAAVLELLASMAIVLAVAALVPRAGIARFAAPLAAAALVIGFTRWPDWGRVSHRRPAVRAVVPALPSDAMVVVATLEPVAYVVPSLPPEVPVLSLVNNFLRVDDHPALLQRRAIERVRAHAGPLLLLAKRGAAEERYYDGGRIFDMLPALGLEPRMDRCAPIRTKLDGEELGLCELTRRPLPEAR